MKPLDVLLVEDEDPKRAHIENYLGALDWGVTIRIARSVNSALDALEIARPHLLLLDMSLPTFDIGDGEGGGRPQGFGGIEVLRQMTLSEWRCPTIVITGYEAFPRESGKTVDLSQLRSELEIEFPAIMKGVLHYNSTFDEWKSQLNKTLSDFIHAGRSKI